MRPSTLDRLATLALIVVPLAFGLFSLSLGQDANWDLRNYHWYDPYALLHGRLTFDLGVANHATFYNPLPDLPLYLAGNALPARLVGFLLGCVHGLNFVLVFLLAEMLLAEAGPTIPTAGRRALAALVAFVGVIGGENLALVGTAFNDNLLSLLIFGAAIVILRRRATLFDARPWPDRGEIIALLFAGVLAGAAAGFKLPTSSYAVGFCLGFLCIGGALTRRFAQGFVFGLGVLAGFALAGGFWMATLWRDYGNPFFPFFNAVFRSPMALTESYRDNRFLPHSLLEVLDYPFVFTRDPMRVGEIVFRDWRIATAYTVLAITLAIFLTQFFRKSAGGPRLSLPARYLIAAAAISFVPWMLIFAVYRYLIPLEMLSPLLCVLALAAWPMPVRWRQAAMVAVLALVTVTTQRGDWEHKPWQPGPFVTAQAPVVSEPSHTLAIITGINPVGWLVPFFPPEIPFIRIQGHLNHPGQPPNGLNDRAHALIAAHQGPLYALFPEYEMKGAEEALAAYGLALDRDSCAPVRSNLGDYVRWCRVVRAPNRT